MIYNELSDTVKRRLMHVNRCPMCNNEILPTQNIQYVKFQNPGRGKSYVFFHTSCLMDFVMGQPMRKELCHAEE